MRLGGRLRGRAVLWSWLIGGTLLSAGIGWLTLRTDPVAAFYAPQGRLWELALGGLLAIHSWEQAVQQQSLGDAAASRLVSGASGMSGTLPEIMQGASLDALLAVGAVLTLLALFLKGASAQAFPGWQAALAVVSTLLVIHHGPSALTNRWLACVPMVQIGKLSYPLYLWHWPLLWLLWLRGGTLTAQQDVVARVLVLLASTVLAWLTLRLLEQRLRRRRDGVSLWGMVALLVLIGGLGEHMVRADGYIDRLPAALRPIARMQGPADFQGTLPEVCVGQPSRNACFEAGHPLVMVWGDSHAAALLPGLAAVRSGQHFALAAWTGCGNPPLLGVHDYRDERCGSGEVRASSNLQALERISQWQPEVLVLHARWTSQDYDFTASALADQLVDTIAEVQRRAPRTRIVVLGPVPVWRDTLSHVLLRTAQREGLPGLPAAWQQEGLVANTEGFDTALAGALAQRHVAYRSAWQALCKGSSCLTRVGEQAQDLTAMDYGHLSPRGATYLVGKLPPVLDWP